MNQSAVAKRYAAALFKTAVNADMIDNVESDLGLITYSLETIPRLAEVLEHPLIPSERKKEIVTDVFSDKVSEISLNFLYLVIDKRREKILADVEAEFVKLANELRGVEPVEVATAVPLTADERTALQEKLEKLTGKKAELHITLDPTLIGGLKIRIGDRIIDGSIAGYLASLRNKLLGKD
jgi:F-type H+-transporting ATPase subunit delta